MTIKNKKIEKLYDLYMHGCYDRDYRFDDDKDEVCGGNLKEQRQVLYKPMGHLTRYLGAFEVHACYTLFMMGKNLDTWIAQAKAREREYFRNQRHAEMKKRHLEVEICA